MGSWKPTVIPEVVKDTAVEEMLKRKHRHCQTTEDATIIACLISPFLVLYFFMEIISDGPEPRQKNHGSLYPGWDTEIH